MHEGLRRHTVLALAACVFLVPQSNADQPASSPDERVTGLLLSASDQPSVTQRVMLIRVRVLNLEGKEITALPARGTAIIDADVNSPVATTQTDTSGRFTFSGVKPGRYSVAVPSNKAPGGAALVQQPQDSRDTLVFDLTKGQPADLGNVRAKKE